MIATPDSRMSLRHDDGNLIDKDDEHTYMYVPFVANATRHLRFTYSVADENCSDCLFPATSKLTLLSMNPSSRSRRRRSWFFGLTTRYEVDQELRKALSISKNWRSMSRVKLDNLAKLLEQTDISVTRNSDSLSKLYDQFCQQQSVSLENIAKVAYRTQIQRSASRLLSVINQCSHGKLPDELDFESVYAICLVHLTKEICDRLDHKVRDVMGCSNKKIRLTPDKYMITLDITVPKALNVSGYDIFEPVTVPIFEGSYQHKISKLKGNHVMKYRNRDSLVILNDCTEVGSTLLCNPSQSEDDKTANCLAGILMNSTQPCFTESYQSNESCFTRTFQHGILVSTKRPLEVHVTDPSGIFRSKARSVNGVAVIANSANVTLTVACNGLLSSTKMIEANPVNIFESHQWILRDTLTPVVNRDLHYKIENDKRKSEETLSSIMSNLSSIESDHNLRWIDSYPSLDSPHGQSSLAIYLILGITGFIISVIAAIIFKKFCCRPGRQLQIVSPPLTNPAFVSQTTPFITTST